MSVKEIAKSRIDALPESKIALVIAYMDGLTDGIAEQVNEVTAASFREMQAGQYETFDTPEALFADLGI